MFCLSDLGFNDRTCVVRCTGAELTCIWPNWRVKSTELLGSLHANLHASLCGSFLTLTGSISLQALAPFQLVTGGPPGPWLLVPFPNPS